MYSINYWKTRANFSGNGSRGDLLRFKINFLNEFIKDNNISSILDFGCGDLHLARELNVDEYVGLDIVERPKPQNVASKSFTLKIKRFDEVSEQRSFDLCMSIDVFFHILKDEEDYLKAYIDNMVNHSSKFVIIYAHDSDDPNAVIQAVGAKHVFNSNWKKFIRAQSNLKLIYEQTSCHEGSFAKFFVFEKF